MNSRASDYRVGNTIFRVAYGDLRKLNADAVVSSDDNYLSMGGGVSWALLSAAGEYLRKDAVKHVPLKLGEVAVTSAGRLPSKYVFHAVTIDLDKMFSPDEESIGRATRKCLELADALGVRRIGFPALGTGVGGFPYRLAAEVMTRTITNYLMADTSLETVTLVLYPGLGQDSDLNTFYERAVASASVASQGERLKHLLIELTRTAKAVGRHDIATVIDELHMKVKHQKEEPMLRVADRADDTRADDTLTTDLSAIAGVVVTLSDQMAEDAVWRDKQLEMEVQRTKLQGLMTQLNIKISQLNRFEIEMAKYGGIGIPPRLETATEELRAEIRVLEEKISQERMLLGRITEAKG